MKKDRDVSKKNNQNEIIIDKNLKLISKIAKEIEEREKRRLKKLLML
ncbi:hypothetical protein HYT25_03920 [Candidatus Pacearchaeota archaeon]|nr:hypothetical protein [Candidatus Pacearchaeota archaeon]